MIGPPSDHGVGLVLAVLRDVLGTAAEVTAGTALHDLPAFDSLALAVFVERLEAEVGPVPDELIVPETFTDPATIARRLVPASTGRAGGLLHDLLDGAARRWPDRVALVTRRDRYTFEELRTRSVAAAAELQRRGVGRGDRVVVVVGDVADAVAWMFGATRRGAAFVPLRSSTPRYAAQHVIDDCAPVCVIGPDPVRAGPGAYRATAVTPLDPACILYTSGSTGRPKGIVATHRNMTFAAHIIVRRLALRPDDVIGCVLPADFDYGLYQMLLGLISGARLAWGERIDAGPRLLGFLGEHEVTVFPAVPGLAHILDRLSARSPAALPPLRMLTNTGAALPDRLRRRLERRFPAMRVYPMFGLTECKRVSIGVPTERARSGSVGRPLDGTECTVVDRRGGALPAGRIGELVVRGPHVTRGYWNDPRLTAARFRPTPGGQRALFTGDQCWLDDDGQLHFVGRDDDIYKSDGFRVSAAEVATAAADIDGVTEAFCLPPRGSAGPLLAVVTDLNAGQVRSRLRTRLEQFKVPERITVVPAMPLKANGKVDAAALAGLAGGGR